MVDEGFERRVRRAVFGAFSGSQSTRFELKFSEIFVKVRVKVPGIDNQLISLIEGGQVYERAEHLEKILSKMVQDGILTRSPKKKDGETAYALAQRLSEVGDDDSEKAYRWEDLEDSDFDQAGVAVESDPRDETGLGIDSSSWTGLPKSGVLDPASVERLLEALQVVDNALEVAELSNLEKAQARAFAVAIRALAEAPDPPADLVHNIITVVAALTGIGSFFIALVALYK